MNQYITFDIGGTDIKFGIITNEGELLFTSHMATDAHKGGPDLIQRVIKKANELKGQYEVMGIAISSAGIIDPYKGEVVYATKAIPNYIGMKIKQLVENETSLITEVQNDVNCFAICEANRGVAINCKNFITLTVGTGVGGAIYMNDSMYYGHDFSAGEWGRMNVLGHQFEEMASITGLIRLAKQYIEEKDWNGKMIFDLYDQNDERAVITINHFYHYLTTGIMNLIYIFNPDKVVIGGGISARGEKFISEIYHHIKKIIEPKFLDNTTIEIAKYSNHSGLIGAFYHYQEMQNWRNKNQNRL